jgi:nucleoside-diphosphate-sugar epimerase/GT2 family glycosyltransferase
LTRLYLSASLVLYKPDLTTLERTLLALQEAGRVAKVDGERLLELTLVDNSSDTDLHKRIRQWLDERRSAMPDWTVHLLQSPGNVGYGRGNNLVIERISSDYHLVVNPDLFVAPDSLREALRFLEERPETGLLTPSVFGEDGERHYLCKRNPTLFVMFLRSFSPKWLQSWFRSTLTEFEMLDCDYDKPIFDVEYPTGACMFFRTDILKKIKGFDPAFFLHYEDADIGRRALQVARVTYVPKVKVVHQWARDTHRSWTSRLVTVRSGLRYWRKWGGVFNSNSRVSFYDRDPVLGVSTKAEAADVRGPSVVFGEGQTVFVTGANGFIGKAVCAELPLRGYRVRGLVRHEQFAMQDGSECLSMTEIDAQTNWSDALKGVDSIVHLAARVHLMRETAADPLNEFRQTNVALTMNLARQAAAAGVRRFVFISSIKVNGEATPVGQPFTPEDMPRPVDPYGISKHEAEQGLLTLAAHTGMEVVIIRPVLVYGKGVKANFHSMMKWLQRGIPLPLGALPNRRSFVALGNLVDLIATCLSHPAAANQIFLASDGADISISGLLRRTGAAMGKSARLISVPVVVLRTGARLIGQEAVVQRLCESLQADISKTRRLLGWEPPVDLDAALKETALHFLQNPK